MMTQTFCLIEEELIPIGSVPDELPKKRGGKKVSNVTVYRWTNRGLAGVAPLETTRIGNALFTSREAIRRFLDRVNRAKDGHRRAIPPAAIPSQAALKADAELAALGM